MREGGRSIEILQKCDLCGSSGPFWTLAAEDPREYQALKHVGVMAERFTTVMCPECGWIFKPGMLTDEQISLLYSTHGGEKTYRRNMPEVSMRSENLYRLLEKYVDTAATLRVLDVGGGAGQVSVAFAENGHEVHIVDIAAGNPLHPAMVIHRCGLDDIHPDQQFDLVIMSHVLEHVWSPTDMLNVAGKLTRPGGYLYIEVPFELYTPLVRRKLGDPCHVGYFALHTLRRLIAKTALSAVFVERGLGRYNARRVMVLTALTRRPVQAEGHVPAAWLPGWVQTMAEMVYPRQVIYTLAYVVASRKSPVFA